MGEDRQETEDLVKEAHWPRILFYTYLQMFVLYGIILAVNEARYSTIIFSLVLLGMCIIGVTAGSHRIWAHGAYTATTSLKVFLMLCQTLAGQGTIYDWVIYHRIHHKYFSTTNDPFNPSRGFLYSHFLCLTRKTTSQHEKHAKEIDMSDLEQDSVVMFQKKYYWPLWLVFSILLPFYISAIFCNESIMCSVTLPVLTRYGLALHYAWFIHSASTIFGLQKGEKYPLDTNIIFILYKTHWLQYHYLTPWDYQTSEFGKYGNDYITRFIKVCAALDLANNLRTVSGTDVQEALHMSLDTKKSISDCLLEVENVNSPRKHYLRNAAYC